MWTMVCCRRSSRAGERSTAGACRTLGGRFGGGRPGHAARRFRLAHVAELVVPLAAGRVAPRSGIAVRVAAVAVVADALGSRAECACPVAGFVVALFLHTPRQACEPALRLAHGAAVVGCVLFRVASGRCATAELSQSSRSRILIYDHIMTSIA